ALLLERHVVGGRAIADHDSGRVDRVLPYETLEGLRQIDYLLHLRIGVVGGAKLLPGLQRFVEVDLDALGDELRDPVDGAVRDLEHTAGVADRGARHHRPEGDDLRDAVATVLLGDVVDHVLPPGYGEVDVHVGHRLAARV